MAVLTAPAQQNAGEPATATKLSMVVFSGDMDKLIAAFIIATGAAAMGTEVTMFFTFWGLQAIRKPVRNGTGIFGKMLGLFLKDLDGVGPSKLNMGGMGRWMFKTMMKGKGAASLPELRQAAIDLGVRFQACQMSLDVMEIKREDLIEGVEDVVGVAAFLENASQSQTTLFI
jgi:peroxiredoxin family protein